MQRFIFSFCLIFSLFVPTKTEAQIGNWLEEIALSGSPNPRHEAGYVGVNGKFYLLGGRRIQAVNIYDPISKTWTNGQAPPLELHHFQPLAYQGKIYAIGAMTGQYPGETPVPNVIIYDPATDTWSTGASIPADRRRGGAGLVLYNNKFYLVCGIIDGHRSGHVNWLDLYDPSDDSWQVLADAPRARDHFQASVVNGKIYALAGRRSQSGQNVFGNTEGKIDVYDIAQDQWTTLNQTLPTQRAGTYNAVYKNEILVFGGESPSQNEAHAEVEALNTLTGSWNTYSPMLTGRHGTGAIWNNDTLYIASGSGGRGGGPELDTQEKFYIEAGSTGASDPKGNNPFQVFPNPSSAHTLVINYDGPLRNLDLQLFTSTGKLIDTKNKLNTFPMEWDLGEYSLQGGLYLIQIKNDTDTFWSKVFLDR